MKHFIGIILCVLFLLPSILRAQKDSIDVFIEAQMKEQRIPGLSVGIVKAGKIIKAAGYGMSNIELSTAASEETVYKIASLSKQFVAVGILQLAEQRKLSLSNPITKFIKNAPAKWRTITIRHLLNHTSGLPVDPPNFDGTKEIPDSVYIVKAFKDTLSFEPGAKYEYSNFGYYILADIIRITSQQPFADYMQQNVFAPCGMLNTRTTTLQAIVPGRAGGYLEGPDKRIENAPNYPAVRPSGAFLSNVNDLLKWEMAMQSGRLFTLRQWDSLWNGGFKTPFTMDGEPIYYGFGWMTNKLGGVQLIHHGGSLPGFKSVYFRLPDDDTAIIVLANADQADMYAIAFGILDRLARQ